MALYGNFNTFALTDLLQWVENARKTGSLVIERGNASRTVIFREGKIVACSTDEAPFRLGQVLLARDLITEQQLRECLAVQEEIGGNLGCILVERGMVSSEDVVRQVAAKAEETIFGLFDWEDASFEFLEDAPVPPHPLDVNLSIQDVLLNGVQRYDEMKRIREVFHDHGIVLARTELEPPENVKKSKVSRRILETVNGQRTLAEIVLHTRASEYLVTKFLFELHRAGFLKIVEIRQTQPHAQPVAVGLGEAGGLDGEMGGEIPGEFARRIAEEAKAMGARQDPVAEIEVAERLLDRGEHGAAVALLNAVSRSHPGIPSVRQMITRVEAAYTDQVTEELPSSSVPAIARQPSGTGDDTLAPDEAFLLSLIDGKSDIKSILWIAPMRTFDVLRGLQKLLQRGIIALTDPA